MSWDRQQLTVRNRHVTKTAWPDHYITLWFFSHCFLFCVSALDKPRPSSKEDWLDFLNEDPKKHCNKPILGEGMRMQTYNIVHEEPCYMLYQSNMCMISYILSTMSRSRIVCSSVYSPCSCPMKTHHVNKIRGGECYESAHPILSNILVILMLTMSS
jgi:hypothetical protein